ncbi:MAG: SDR family oxidoreductase [Christensenellaceae bacterium]|jgi:NAD(P)-dependent dehydrogenase (short-subunit alcohol dehydrogenase family)|nr:SDR family oxidoreductase [Christensenellaceae bacterium]
MSKTVVITGAGGVLCSVFAEDFVKNGAKVALLDISAESLERLTAKLGVNAIAFPSSVLDKSGLQEVEAKIRRDLGVTDILINGAGGNSARATTDEESCFEIPNGKSFFDLGEEGIDFVFNLNFKGAFLTTQVFAKAMAERKSGNILNISSMNAFTPLTKIPAYSAAKAAISNFTAWLATYFAPQNLRVNAIAPGFFSTNQNKTLLYNADGSLTARSHKIISGTPMGRFGAPNELLGAVRFLTDDSLAAFITGVVLPVDGGYNAYSGV